MPSIFVGMTPESFERLYRLSKRERRRPHDQAAVLLERALGEVEPSACEDFDRDAVRPTPEGAV